MKSAAWDSIRIFDFCALICPSGGHKQSKNQKAKGKNI
jgi:hypothetical protein